MASSGTGPSSEEGEVDMSDAGEGLSDEQDYMVMQGINPEIQNKHDSGCYSGERTSDMVSDHDKREAKIYEDHPTRELREQPMRDEELIGEAHDVRKKLKEGIGPKNLKPNILIIGLQGAGKSSLINSLHTAVDKDGYHEVAQRGSFGEYGVSGQAAVTLSLTKHRLFSRYKKGSEERSFKCLPRFWDCPGLQDVADENMAAILNLILEGYIPDDSNLTTLRTMTAQKLYKKYSTSQKKNCIDILVYVHAATDPVPENLLDVIRGTTHKDMPGCRFIPIVVVVTKTDTMKDVIKSTELEKRIEELTKRLGIYGVTERIFPTSLYRSPDRTGISRLRSIDKDMCKLWHCLLDPHYYPDARTGR